MSHRRQWARGVGNSLGLPQPRLGRHEKDTGEEEVVQGGGSGRFLVVPNLAPATVPFPSAALHAPSQEAQADPILSGLSRGVANSCSQASMQLGHVTLDQIGQGAP